MNKPIIIDGVDVSECPNYSEKNDTGEWCDLTCTRENAPYFRCESMPNCLFKQLQRLKAENEELKDYSRRMENQRENYYKGFVKIRNVLEEIREITKKHYLSDKKLIATGIMYNPIYTIIKIQEKINEVLK